MWATCVRPTSAMSDSIHNDTDGAQGHHHLWVESRHRVCAGSHRDARTNHVVAARSRCNRRLRVAGARSSAAPRQRARSLGARGRQGGALGRMGAIADSVLVYAQLEQTWPFGRGCRGASVPSSRCAGADPVMAPLSVPRCCGQCSGDVRRRGVVISRKKATRRQLRRVVFAGERAQKTLLDTDFGEHFKRDVCGLGVGVFGHVGRSVAFVASSLRLAVTWRGAFGIHSLYARCGYVSWSIGRRRCVLAISRSRGWCGRVEDSNRPRFVVHLDSSRGGRHADFDIRPHNVAHVRGTLLTPIHVVATRHCACCADRSDTRLGHARPILTWSVYSCVLMHGSTISERRMGDMGGVGFGSVRFGPIGWVGARVGGEVGAATLRSFGVRGEGACRYTFRKGGTFWHPRQVPCFLWVCSSPCAV